MCCERSEKGMALGIALKVAAGVLVGGEGLVALRGGRMQGKCPEVAAGLQGTSHRRNRPIQGEARDDSKLWTN